MLRVLLIAACVTTALSQCSTRMNQNDCQRQACYWDPTYASCLECGDARSTGGWRQFRDLEYQVYTNRYNWFDANSRCVAQGGTLADIKDDATFDFIKKYLGNVLATTSIDLWVNLIDKTTTANHVFSVATGTCTSGTNCPSTPATFYRTTIPKNTGTIWGGSEPNGGGVVCARLKSDRHPSFILFDWDCNGNGNSDKFWYLCQRPVPAGQWVPAGTNKRMRVFNAAGDQSNIYCAQLACQDTGGGLATFRNAAEETAAVNAMTNQGISNAIIGLQKIRNGQVFSWYSEAGYPSTTSTTYFENFATGLSTSNNNWVGVLGRTSSWGWSMELATFKSSYICEKINPKVAPTAGSCSAILGLNANNVILNMPFDENSGTTTTSIEGSFVGVPAALNSGVSWSTGKFASSLNLNDGATIQRDQVTLPSYLHGAGGYPMSDFTVSFWLKARSSFFSTTFAQAKNVVSIGMYYNNLWQDNSGWAVQGSSSGLQLCGSGGGRSECATISFSASWVDTWTHFALVQDSTGPNIRGYVNGVATPVGSGTLPRIYDFFAAPVGGIALIGGSRNRNLASASMELDDLMLINAKVSATNIRHLMNNCKQTCTDGTFDESVNNVLPIDESSCLIENTACPALTCTAGYSGSPVVTCVGSAWVISGTPCSEITCAKSDLDWAARNMQNPNVASCNTFNKGSCSMLACQAGYDGTVEIQCTAPSTWTVTGTCNVLMCTAFPYATHFITPGTDLTACDSSIEGQCFPSCQSMYEFAGLAVTVQCIKSGSQGVWIVGNSCVPVTCAPAWVGHAAVNMKATNSASCRRMIDPPCSPACIDGYMAGFLTPELSCGSMGWEIAGGCAEIVCQASAFDFVTNQILPVTQAALTTCDGTTESATPCALTCASGGTGSPTLHCDLSGNWVVGGVPCAPTPCPVASFDPTTDNVNNPIDFTICDQVGKPACNLTCATGYEVVTALPTLSLTCAVGGVWQVRGGCDPILCITSYDFAANHVDALTAMQLDACDGVPDSSCPLDCSNGYAGSPQLECSGSPPAWNQLGTACTAITCSASSFDPTVGPFVPLTAAYLTTTCGSTVMGDCNLNCQLNYTGSGILSCANTGNYIYTGSCSVVECTTPFNPAPYNVQGVITTSHDEAPNPSLNLTCLTNYVGSASLNCDSTGTWVVTGGCSAVTCNASAFNAAAHSVTPVGVFAPCATSTSGHCTLSCIASHSGAPLLECLTSGAWDVSGTLCTPKVCVSPFSPATHFVQSLSTAPCQRSTDSPCSLTCLVGYVGSPSLSCTNSSIWDVQGTCTAIQCDATMFDNSLHNVNQITSPAIDACDRSNSSSCPLICNTGYTGTASLECDQTGSWVVTGSCDSAACTPASFNAPSHFVTAPGSYALCDNVLDPTCSLTCLSKYSGSPQLNCTLVGGIPVWQVNGVACTPIQCDTTTIDVTTVNAIQPTATEFLSCDQATESTCSLTCATNHTGTATVACIDQLSAPVWNLIGSCSPISCSGSIFDASANSVQDLLIKTGCDDSTKTPCALTCLPGYQGSPQLGCKNDGTWTVLGTSCTAMSCVTLMFDESANNVNAIAIKTQCDTVPKGHCPLTCVTGYEGNPELVCTGSGVWQVDNPCTAVTCTLASFNAAGNNIQPVADVTPCDEVLEGTCAVSCTTAFMGSPEIHCTHKDVWEVRNPCGIISCGSSFLDVAANFLSAAPTNLATCDEVSEGTCTATCAVGYEGSPLVKCISKDTFDIQGTVCTPITCSLSSFDHAANFINAPVVIDLCNTVPEGTCAVTCLSSYDGSPTIKCTATNTWDVQGTVCTAKSCSANVINFSTLFVVTRTDADLTACNEVPEGSCNLQCLPGYSGSPTVSCTNTDIWSNGGTPCEPIKCTLASLNAAAKFMVSPVVTTCDEVSKGSCTTACITGYSGSPVINCTSLNNWDVVGTCDPITCSLSSLDTASSSITTQTASDISTCDQVIKGSCNPTCASGYSGSPQIQCISQDSWSITGTPCIAISCTEVSFDKAMHFVHSFNNFANCDTVPESSCTGVCLDGYEGSPDIKCVATDSWSVTGTVCETIKCAHADLTPVASSNEVVLPSSTDLLRCDEVIESSGCTASCNVGYSGTPTVTCTSKNTWSVMPTCSVIYCSLSNLDHAAHNIIQPSDITACETVPQGKCSVQCDPNYSGSPEIRCINLGVWDVVGTCEPLKCTTGFDFGTNNVQFISDLSACNEKRLSECPLQCTAGYSGSPKLTCAGADTWELVDPCEEIKCTAAFQAATHNVQLPSASVLLTCDTVPKSDCMLTCLDGYEGSSTLSCVGLDTWQVGGVACTPITCAFATFDADLNNIDKTGLSSQSDVSQCDAVPKGSCRVQCNTEFVGSPKLVCASKDVWEIHPPCTPKSCSVGFVKESFYLESQTAASITRCDQVVKVPCNPTCAVGYTGAPSLKCVDQNKWEIQNTPCTPIKCDSANFNSAFYKVSNLASYVGCDTVPKGECLLTCIDGYKGNPTLGCIGTGQWEVKNPCEIWTCDKVFDSAANFIKSNSVTTSSCNDEFKTPCSAQCIDDYSGSPTVTCKEGEFVVLNGCDSIKCGDLYDFNKDNLKPISLLTCNEAHEGSCTTNCADGYSFGTSTGSAKIDCVKSISSPTTAKFELSGPVCYESCVISSVTGISSNCSSLSAVHGSSCSWIASEGYTCLNTGTALCTSGSFSQLPSCTKSCVVPTVTGADSSCSGTYADDGTTCTWTAQQNYTCPASTSARCEDGNFKDKPECERKCLVPEVKGSNSTDCVVGQLIETTKECTWVTKSQYDCLIPGDRSCKDGVLEVPTCVSNCVLPYPWIPNISAEDCFAGESPAVPDGRTCTWKNSKPESQDCIGLGPATCVDGNFTTVPECTVRSTDAPPTDAPPTAIPTTPVPPTASPPTPEPVPLKLILLKPQQATKESVLQSGKVRIVLGLEGATWHMTGPRNAKIATVRPEDTQFWISKVAKEGTENAGFMETAPPPKVVNVSAESVVLEIGPIEKMNVFSDETLVISAVLSSMNRYTTQNVPTEESTFISADKKVVIQAESSISAEAKDAVTSSAAAGASQAGRTLMILKLLDCPYEFDDDQLSFAENPTGLTVGPWAKFPHRTGAFLGNIMLISGLVVFHGIIAFTVYYVRKDNNKVHTLLGAMGMARFPNYCFLPAMFFYQITLESSLGVLFYDPYVWSKILSIAAIVFLNGSVAVFIIYPTMPHVFSVVKNAKFFYWPASKSIWAKLRNFVFGPGDYFSARDTSFIWRCGLVFQDFWPKYHRFMICELVFVSILSLIDAIEAQSVAQCRAQLWVILVLYLIFTALLIKCRPYHANINNLTSIGSSGFQTATVALILAHLYSEAPEETDWMIETAKGCLYISIIMFLTKTTVDICM